MRQDGGAVILIPIGQKQGHTAGRHHLPDLMAHALGHRQGTLTHVDRPQSLALRVYRWPYPMGRP